MQIPSTYHARQTLPLVGKIIRPVRGSERWAFANERPAAGIVWNIHIPDLEHTYLVCDFNGVDAYLSHFEVEVLGEAPIPDTRKPPTFIREHSVSAMLACDARYFDASPQRDLDALHIWCMGA